MGGDHADGSAALEPNGFTTPFQIAPLRHRPACARNLLDTDSDEATVELPPSLPETEFTPVLYVLAKNRIDRMSDLVSKLLNDTREHPCSEIMELDQKLRPAETLLPPIFRWKPLSLSFMVPPNIVVHRIWLYLSMQRLTIWLHRKYLTPSYAHAQYELSRNACIKAAIKTLEFQQLVDEETKPDGLLHPVRFMMTTSLGQFVFLSGMSILSYFVQLAKTQPGVALDQDTGVRIYNLLRNSCPIWLRSSAVSREARKAIEHLSLLLGLRERQVADVPLAERVAEAAFAAISSCFTSSQDATMSFD